jgi:hypothetical protein
VSNPEIAKIAELPKLIARQLRGDFAALPRRHVQVIKHADCD